MLAPLSPSCARRLSIAGTLLLGWALARPASAQVAPRILHDGVGCIVSGQHAVIESLVEPADDLVTVKVYFRAEIYPAFFYVEAELSGDRYRAVLPRATRDVTTVVYYLEAVDRAFNSFRTEEFRPRVVRDPADCDDDPQPAYVADAGGITVGATAAGSNFPPGFLTEGIVGTITAAGRAAGSSTGTLIAVGAAAGAAVGVGVLVGGGDDATTTIPPGGSATTTAAVTTTAPLTTSVPSSSTLVACFDTSPNPPSIPVGETVRFDASCTQPRDEIASYVWDFNDGRDGRDGRVVTRQYQSAGVFPAELVVTDIRGVQARIEKDVFVNDTAGPGGGPGGPTTTVPGSADLQVTGLSNPSPRVNNPVNYTVNYRNAGPDPDPTVSLVISFNAAGAGGAPVPVNTPGCGTSSGSGSLTVSCFIGSLASGAAGSKTITVRFVPPRDTYSVTATVFGGTSDPNPGNDSRSVSTNVRPFQASEAPETSFVSEIQTAAPGQVQASIEMNGLGASTAPGGGPIRHRMKGQPGPNVLAGYAASARLEGALWRFDFSGTEGFVPGSIAVDAGDVVSAGSHAVVFRLAGNETRIRFRFGMEP